VGKKSGGGRPVWRGLQVEKAPTAEGSSSAKKKELRLYGSDNCHRNSDREQQCGNGRLGAGLSEKDRRHWNAGGGDGSEEKKTKC